MNKPVPNDPRYGREAVDRIIRRAAELQLGDRDVGGGLDEKALLELGAEVGIPPQHLRQALLEETSAQVNSPAGPLTWFTGEALIGAARLIPRGAPKVEKELSHLMGDVELLGIKRRFPDKTSWEPRKDFASSIKRSLGIGKGSYELARAQEIVGQVVSVSENECHVTLSADLRNSRVQYLVGSTTLITSGAATGLIASVIGIALPVALIPVAFCAVGGVAIARSRRSLVERMRVALEQVLDLLEHDEVKTDLKKSLEALPLARIAKEIGRSFKPPR